MSSYGRNFDFRIPPESENRAGRFVTPTTRLQSTGSGSTSVLGAGLIPIGAPVEVDYNAAAVMGMQVVKLSTTAKVPVGGQMGIAVYEFGPAAFAGTDPLLTTYSDMGVVPLGKAVQVVSGPYVKVVFTNTTEGLFLGQRDYPGRVMVAGLGATPTVAAGDYLSPGDGDDTDGYWAETSDATKAWMVVTSVSVARQEVEARMLF